MSTSTSSEKLVSVLEGTHTTDSTDTQEESSQSGSETNEKEELQKDERNLLSYVTKMYLMDLRQWPIFDYLLKSNLISQLRIVMAYSWDHKAIIVTEDKNVFSFSIDCFKPSNSFTLIRELCGENIKTFAHSVYSTLALTEKGEVYICQYKKRKLIKTRGFVMFTRVDSLIKKKIHIVDIACGHNHYIILTNNGIVYAWGRNTYGQVGNDSMIPSYHQPQHVKHALENKNVVQIACGSAFNIVLTDEGKLYGWGNNENGQISIDDTQHNSSSDSVDVSNFKSGYKYPREITTISDKIVKVACGDDHTLALTDKGKVYAWGKNDFGQVGVATEQDFSHPTMVNMPETPVDIAACNDTSAVIDNNGTIYVWGDCFGQRITTPYPTILSRIHDVFAQTRFYNAMHKPLIFSTDDYMIEELNILESLGATFDDPSTSDFTIQVEEHLIHVHKAILKIRSQYFRDKFQRDCTENDQSSSSSSVIYTVTDKYSYIVYKAFLKYLYTGIVDVPSENASELMKLADEYHETNLKRDCGQLIKRAITSSNVAFFYTKIIEHNVKELEDFCFQFALRHMKAVVLSEDYIKLDMNTKDKLIRKAAKEDVFRT